MAQTAADEDVKALEAFFNLLDDDAFMSFRQALINDHFSRGISEQEFIEEIQSHPDFRGGS